MIVAILIVIVAVIIKISGLYNIILKQIYPKKYSEYVEKYSAEYNIDPLLIYSVIKAESNFKEDVVSNSNAKGLMQLMDSTADEVANNIIPHY